MLSFETGQRESGFYSGRTDRRTEPPSTVSLYRFDNDRSAIMSSIDYVERKEPRRSFCNIF